MKKELLSMSYENLLRSVIVSCVSAENEVGYALLTMEIIKDVEQNDSEELKRIKNQLDNIANECKEIQNEVERLMKI